MAARLYDSFNRNSATTLVALGASDSGHPYIDLSSQSSAVGILNNAARMDSAATLAAAVLDAGALGGDGELGCTLLGRGAGVGLYFRAVDAINWWRAYQRAYSYQFQSGTETYVSSYNQVLVGYQSVLVGYQQVGTGTYYYTPSDGWQFSYSAPIAPGNVNYTRFEAIYEDYDARIGAFRRRYDYNNGRILYYLYREVYENTISQPIYQSQPVYESQPVYSTRPIFATATGYDLQIEKMVAGALTTVAARQITGPFTGLRVVLAGDRIDAYVPGQVSVPVIDGTHQLATRHGIGRGKPSELENSNADLLDSFYFNPRTSGSLMPPVLL